LRAADAMKVGNGRQQFLKRRSFLVPMKPALLAICCAFFLAGPHQAMADPMFDQDMASRYLRAAQSGDDEAQFYLGALYSAGVGVPRSDEEAFLSGFRARPPRAIPTPC